MIRPVKVKDANKIAAIYNYYIEKTVITFEENQVTSKEIENRIAEKTRKLPWLVFEEGGEVLGYAYASPWAGRCSYRFSAEVTVYLNVNAKGKGIGSKLYSELLTQLKALNYHVVIGGVTLPNVASVALHEKFGFEKVAHYKEIGFKFDRWLDVGYWQLLLKYNY